MSPAVGPFTVPVRITTKLPMAWRHHCGHLNDSPWPSADRRAFCTGCRSDVRLTEVEARYLLAEIDNGGTA